MEILTGILRSRNFSDWFEDLYRDSPIIEMYEYVASIANTFTNVCGYTDVLYDRGELFIERFFESSFNQATDRFEQLELAVIARLCDEVCNTVSNNAPVGQTDTGPVNRSAAPSYAHFSIGVGASNNSWLLLEHSLTGATTLRGAFNSRAEACRRYRELTGLTALTEDEDLELIAALRYPAVTVLTSNSPLVWRVPARQSTGFREINIQPFADGVCIGFGGYIPHSASLLPSNFVIGAAFNDDDQPVLSFVNNSGQQIAHRVYFYFNRVTEDRQNENNTQPDTQT